MVRPWLSVLLQDIFQQNLGKTGAPFGGSRAVSSSLSSATLTAPHTPGRPPGRKRGPKPREGPAGAPDVKKRGKMHKARAGDLDLLEIHTKHTLKKHQPGNKGRSKVRTPSRLPRGWRRWNSPLTGILLYSEIRLAVQLEVLVLNEICFTLCAAGRASSLPRRPGGGAEQEQTAAGADKRQSTWVIQEEEKGKNL